MCDLNCTLPLCLSFYHNLQCGEISSDHCLPCPEFPKEAELEWNKGLEWNSTALPERPRWCWCRRLETGGAPLCVSLAGVCQAGRSWRLLSASSFLLCHQMMGGPNSRTVLLCTWIYCSSCCEFSSLRNGPKSSEEAPPLWLPHTEPSRQGWSSWSSEREQCGVCCVSGHLYPGVSLRSHPSLSKPTATTLLGNHSCFGGSKSSVNGEKPNYCCAACNTTAL